MEKFLTAAISFSLVLGLTGCSRLGNSVKLNNPPVNDPDDVIEETEVEKIAPSTEAMPVDDSSEKLQNDDENISVCASSINLADFVLVRDYIDNIKVDLPYAGSNNFTGTLIYDFDDAYLRYGTILKLQNVQRKLNDQGFGLLIWDAFRPVSAQYKLWEAYPNSKYVANPINGFSSHSRGNTVDVSLLALDGSEVLMPTGFDDFSALADRDYSDCDQLAAEHAILLENIMSEAGFKPYFGEWWHFSDVDEYPVEYRSIDELIS